MLHYFFSSFRLLVFLEKVSGLRAKEPGARKRQNSFPVGGRPEAEVRQDALQVIFAFAWRPKGFAQQVFGIWILGYLFFFYNPLSYCQSYPSPHFRTNWHSWLGLGYQVGSTTDRLLLLPTPKDPNTMWAELGYLIYIHVTWLEKKTTKATPCYSKNEDNLMFDHTSLVF